MPWKGGATPHLLPTLCTIRSRKTATAVTVAPKHTCGLKLLPPKLHNELKSSIDRTILALGRINAPTHNQRAAEIGVGIVPYQNYHPTPLFLTKTGGELWVKQIK
jgi:hypothetical protein